MFMQRKVLLSITLTYRRKKRSEYGDPGQLHSPSSGLWDLLPSSQTITRDHQRGQQCFAPACVCLGFLVLRQTNLIPSISLCLYSIITCNVLQYKSSLSRTVTGSMLFLSLTRIKGVGGKVRAWFVLTLANNSEQETRMIPILCCFNLGQWRSNRCSVKTVFWILVSWADMWNQTLLC